VIVTQVNSCQTTIAKVDSPWSYLGLYTPHRFPST